MDINETHFLPPGGQVVHGLLGGLGGGAHEDDDPFRVRSAIVVKEVIGAAGDAADFHHVLLHGGGDGVHLLIAGLPALEEDVRVYGGAAGGRVLRVQGVGPEGLQ